jgi:Glycosyl hydrolases family 16
MDRRSLLKLGLGGVASLVATRCSARGVGDDPAHPPGWAAGVSPAPIAGRGYRLVFDDEFDGPLDVGERGRRWCPHLWYDKAAEPRQYGQRDSCLYLRSFRDAGWPDCNLTTEWGDTRSGTFFRGGYFEARIRCPQAWSAFWLFSVKHSRGVAKNGPEDWAGEIDILETDSARPTSVYGTLHRNTSGPRYGGPPDKTNASNGHDVHRGVFDDWHSYGVLWTREEVVWFFDDREVSRTPSFESTWQEMFLILGLGKGGVDGGPPPASDVQMIEMLVDWVRVWQQPEQGQKISIEE